MQPVLHHFLAAAAPASGKLHYAVATGATRPAGITDQGDNPSRHPDAKDICSRHPDIGNIYSCHLNIGDTSFCHLEQISPAIRIQEVPYPQNRYKKCQNRTYILPSSGCRRHLLLSLRDRIWRYDRMYPPPSLPIQKNVINPHFIRV